MELAKNLRHLLEARGYSVAKLSQLSGVPAKTIYHWTNGQKPRNVEQLISVCEALGTSVEAIFSRPEAYKQLSYISLGEVTSDLHLGKFEVILRPLTKSR